MEGWGAPHPTGHGLFSVVILTTLLRELGSKSGTVPTWWCDGGEGKEPVDDVQLNRWKVGGNL